MTMLMMEGVRYSLGANLLLPVLIGTLIGSDPSQPVLLAANLAVFVGLTLLITIATFVALAVASRLDGRHPTAYGFDRSAGWARDFAGGVAIGATAVITTLIYEGIHGRMSLSIETADVGTQSLFVAVVAVAVMFVFFLANNVFEEYSLQMPPRACSRGRSVVHRLCS